MKFNLVQNATVLLLGAVALSLPSSAQAGWGVLRGGSSGGGDSSGYASSGASSGGYTAAYGSSGYAAAYGSSGYAAAYGSSGGASSGGYTAAYSSVGGSSGAYGGSSGGRPGLLQRVAERIHDHIDAKRARHAARRTAYGSSGGYASSGGSVGYSYASYGGGSSGGYGVSYGSSGGGVSYGSTGYSSGVSYGSTGYSSGVGYGSTGVYYGASNSQTSAASLVSNATTAGDAVYLTVAVPSDAKVFVNNDQTSSTGTVRKFVSHGLEAGKQYRFVVRAELTAADGRLLTEEKSLVVSAGEQEELQFAFADSYSPIETAITLNLPEEAKVMLAGNETKASGETRTFRTSRLKVGELWDDYEIEVHYDGQVKRQTVRLVGGDQLELTFDFDQDAANLAAK